MILIAFEFERGGSHRFPRVIDCDGGPRERRADADGLDRAIDDHSTGSGEREGTQQSAQGDSWEEWERLISLIWHPLLLESPGGRG